MKRALICLALLAGSSPGYAQSPGPTPAPTPSPLAITGTTTITEFTQATLSVTGSSGPVLWMDTPGLSITSFGADAVCTGRPGKYQLTAVGTTATGLAKTSPFTLVIEPTEKPRMIAVFDPSGLTSLPAGQVAIYQSTTIAASLAAQGVVWSQYSIGDVVPSKNSESAPFATTTWGSKANSVGLPALVTCSNGVVSAAPLPSTEAAIVGQSVQLGRAK